MCLGDDLWNLVANQRTHTRFQNKVPNKGSLRPLDVTALEHLQNEPFIEIDHDYVSDFLS
jgi:hypothetical protein